MNHNHEAWKQRIAPTIANELSDNWAFLIHPTYFCGATLCPLCGLANGWHKATCPKGQA